jgi:hypothetical protein
MKRMYIGGPIFGLTPDDVAYRFAHGVALTRELRYKPVSAIDIEPVPHVGACPSGRRGTSDHNEGCHLRADLLALLDCQAMLVLRGWQASWGTKLELSVATAAGLHICFLGRAGDVTWA